MTTNLRRSIPLALLLTGAVCLTLLITSCGGPKGDGVWIPIPKDTTGLGMRDHYIPKDSIAAYRKRFIQDRDTIQNKVPYLFIPLAEAFNKKSIIDLLKDSNCIGIRVYYGSTGMEKNGQQDVRLILVGVDKKGGDLYVRRSSTLGAKDGDDGEGGFEYGQCTPPCYKDTSAP
jgi:hypothetical protein